MQTFYYNAKLSKTLIYQHNKIMKKILMIALMSIVSFAAFAQAQHTQCLLHHQGKISMYSVLDLSKALDSAVDGDTLYLPEYNIPAFELSKCINVRGVGDEKTKINGTLKVNIPKSAKVNTTLLEGLYCTNGVELISDMDGVSIKKCWMSSFVSSGNNSNIEIESSYINNFYESDKIESCKISHCKIKNYIPNSAESPNLTILNTNIYIFPTSSYDQVQATFINCIIRNYYKYSYYSGGYTNYVENYFQSMSKSSFINCLLASKPSSYLLMQDCYTGNCLNESLNSTFTDEKMAEYIGSDGNIIGANGGSTPYTLTLDIPKISESEIFHDAVAKQLNVSIKVSAK